MRLALPGTPLGVSTGAWIAGSGAEREHAVAGWTELPDFASVNFDEAGAEALVLLHGPEATAWPLLDEAAHRGYDARIGLEDTLSWPDGTIAQGNRALVAEARRRLTRAV
jgi:uncharacterized protein (DUF849 family)